MSDTKTKVIMLGKFTVRGQELGIADQLVVYLDNTPVDAANPQKGFTSGDIRKRAKVADKIEAAGKADANHVELDADQYAILMGVMSNVSFAVADRSLLKLLDAVENAGDGPYVPPPIAMKLVDPTADNGKHS